MQLQLAALRERQQLPLLLLLPLVLVLLVAGAGAAGAAPAVSDTTRLGLVVVKSSGAGGLKLQALAQNGSGWRLAGLGVGLPAVVPDTPPPAGVAAWDVAAVAAPVSSPSSPPSSSPPLSPLLVLTAVPPDSFGQSPLAAAVAVLDLAAAVAAQPGCAAWLAAVSGSAADDSGVGGGGGPTYAALPGCQVAARVVGQVAGPAYVTDASPPSVRARLHALTFVRGSSGSGAGLRGMMSGDINLTSFEVNDPVYASLGGGGGGGGLGNVSADAAVLLRNMTEVVDGVGCMLPAACAPAGVDGGNAGLVLRLMLDCGTAVTRDVDFVDQDTGELRHRFPPRPDNDGVFFDCAGDHDESSAFFGLFAAGSDTFFGRVTVDAATNATTMPTSLLTFPVSGVYDGTPRGLAMWCPLCLNNGTCNATTLTCECTGYTGLQCETPVCALGCQNGGECIGPDICNCTSSYSGATCEDPVCDPVCANGGNCTSPGNCDCPSGWSGPTTGCGTFTCTDAPCLNGGVCDGPNVCNCSATPFSGAQCDVPVCTPACENGGACVVGGGPTPSCNCSGTGYTGTTCSVPVCNTPCANGGTCLAPPQTCSCPSNFTGPSCSTPNCIPPCLNGGTCVNNLGVRCFCAGAVGYSGPQCETPICTAPCLNGGRCSAPDTCNCTNTGFAGPTCTDVPTTGTTGVSVTTGQSSNAPSTPPSPGSRTPSVSSASRAPPAPLVLGILLVLLVLLLAQTTTR